MRLGYEPRISISILCSMSLSSPVSHPGVRESTFLYTSGMDSRDADDGKKRNTRTFVVDNLH